ncbi:type VII secretion target [Streptomyces natalensis]|uniref:type VII secretion target n=1 Tax=Streptomyces natalensis TaxID=68242 RepID=UPI0004AB47AB|nr:type VII secretion target [Streptomyces natalensis]
MLSTTFEARPAGIRDLATEFSTAADDIESRLKEFAGQAAQIGTAFGLLAACADTTSQYLEALTRTEEQIAQLAALLRDSGLVQSAAHYECVESETASFWGGRS